MSQQIALGEKGELWIWLKYSETPPYGHLVITATFLWPPVKNCHTFSCEEKKTVVDTATPLIGQILFGPLVTVLTEFHCMLSRIKKRVWILAIGLRENPS